MGNFWIINSSFPIFMSSLMDTTIIFSYCWETARPSSMSSLAIGQTAEC